MVWCLFYHHRCPCNRKTTTTAPLSEDRTATRTDVCWEAAPNVCLFVWLNDLFATCSNSLNEKPDPWQQQAGFMPVIFRYCFKKRNGTMLDRMVTLLNVKYEIWSHAKRGLLRSCKKANKRMLRKAKRGVVRNECSNVRCNGASHSPPTRVGSTCVQSSNPHFHVFLYTFL